MAHPKPPKEFTDLEAAMHKRAAAEPDRVMRNLADEMVLHVCWQAKRVQTRTQDHRESMDGANNEELLELHREASGAFVRLARMHTILDAMDATAEARRISGDPYATGYDPRVEPINFHRDIGKSRKAAQKRRTG